MRYEDLTNAELQDKAKEAGIKRPGTLTREQLIAALSEKGFDGTEGKKSNFVTPVVDQGSKTSGAFLGPRDVPGADEPGTGEIAPVEGEQADQSSLGGTGGVTVTDLGDSQS